MYLLRANSRGQLWWSRSWPAMRGIVVFLACARYTLVKFDWRNFPCSPSRDSSEDEGDFKRVSLCVDYPDPAGIEIYISASGVPSFPGSFLFFYARSALSRRRNFCRQTFARCEWHRLGSFIDSAGSQRGGLLLLNIMARETHDRGLDGEDKYACFILDDESLPGWITQGESD